jgi:hypothetical protein
MEKNINPDINRLNMETSKNAADSLRGWAGLDASKSPVASSFLNGATSQMINESKDTNFSPKRNQDPIFSFGLLNTVSALKNSSLYDLPAGKIMLEKFEGLLVSKNIPEAFLIEGFIQELQSFSWEDSASTVLENIIHIFENRRREIEVIKTYESIKNTPGRDLFSDATSTMQNWLISEKRSTDSLLHGLKRFGFNPMVRSLVSFLSVYENKVSNKFYVGADNSVCEVSNIYSPLLVTESGVIFFSSGKYFKIDESTQSISECQMEEVPTDFQAKAVMVDDRDINIDNNKITLNIGKNKVEIVFENKDKSIYYDGKKISESDLPLAVSVSTGNLLEGANSRINRAVFVAATSDEIVDIDFGKKIKSKVYEGVEANIFKSGDKIYVQTVNPAMKLNKIYEANATQAVNIIKEFIKFDISESLTEFLNGEEAFLSVMKNDKKQIVHNIEILEGELRKIDNAKQQYPLIAESPELLQIQEGIETEITSLKNKWNQVNIEIERFEKKANDISSVNEDMGYPIDTEVRVKRNGVKGKVIGVDGSSKTYTILFKEGRTGEYFFSDVENLEDEIDQYDISTPDMDLQFTNESDQNFSVAPGTNNKSAGDKAFEKMYKKNLAEAPEKEAKGSAKFIQDETNFNYAGAPEATGKGMETSKNKVANTSLSSAPLSSKKASVKKFIEETDNSNLAKAPSSNIKSASEFIDDLKNQNLALKENQKNSHTVKAPSAKSEKPKKFVEDEENADLAEAPGNHKKDGKEFVEDTKRANLSSAPKTKKK